MRRKDRLAAKHPNARLMEFFLVASDTRGFALAIERLRGLAPIADVGIEDQSGRVDQASLFVFSELREEGAIGGDAFEEGNRRAEVVGGHCDHRGSHYRDRSVRLQTRNRWSESTQIPVGW